MSSVVISGDTSGAITVAAPAVAGTNTITLPALTGTAVIAGQNSAITAGTAVASTSGTSIDFTGIPSWVKRITVMFSGVSTNGAAVPMLRLGTSSGVEATGYSGIVTSAQGVNAGTYSTSMSTGFSFVYDLGDPTVMAGTMTISLLGSNIWTCTWIGANTNGSNIQTWYCAGTKTLSGTLDRVRITTANGTDTFDAGSINILYE